jgi:pimeloyl-ACP methyl ester carboxylesterase
MVLLYIAVSLGLAICILYMIPGYTLPIKDKDGKLLKGSIASLEKVKLGGQEQWILIRGEKESNPVILFLHGGPGTSDMGLLRRYMSELEKHFVVVSWDQRGAGKSFHAINPNSSMNVNQFVSDACELTKILCSRFNQKKIFLAGHSWGSVLGILTVQKQPEYYYSFTGIGQTVNMAENEMLSYDWTYEQAKKANNLSDLNKLNEIGKPPYSGNWKKKFMTERRLLAKYGGEVYNNTKGAFPVVLGSLLRSTEYTLADKINFFRGIFKTVGLVFPELMKINLMEQAPELKIPVYFVLGRHDHEAPSFIAEKYFNVLKAPRKELIWFENSAHMPNIEENKKFTDFLINRVLLSAGI